MPARRNVRRLSRDSAALVRAVATVDNATRRTLLSNGSAALVRALVACVRMIIKGDVSLTSAQLTGLRRHASDIRELLKPGATLQKKRRVLQKGGFLPLLMGLAKLLL